MKRGTPRHPKVGHLCELLKVKIPTAVGYLELLWHFTAEFAPQGDIGKFTDTRIEAGIHWSGASCKLVSALVEAGWIDRNDIHRLVVHSWHEHADDAVRKKLQRTGLQFLSIAEEVTGQSQTSAENGSLPEPSLARAQPEPTPTPTEMPSRVPRKPTAIDSSEGNEPFERFWGMWCSLTKRGVRKLETGRTWVQVVNPEDEEAMIACLQRYGGSDEVSRGVVKNPDTWLREQASDGWSGTWPPKRGLGLSQTTKQQQNADAWGNA